MLRPSMTSKRELILSAFIKYLFACTNSLHMQFEINLVKVEKCLQIQSRQLPPSETGVAATQWATCSYKMMK